MFIRWGDRDTAFAQAKGGKVRRLHVSAAASVSHVSLQLVDAETTPSNVAKAGSTAGFFYYSDSCAVVGLSCRISSLDLLQFFLPAPTFEE
jgi:hypothetical protein